MTKELRDYFKIDDSHSKIRGFVVITDENGKILVKKENMIVKSGRNMIFNAITGGDGLNLLTSLSAVLSSNASLSSEDMTYAKDVDGYKLGSPVSISANKNEDDLYIKFTASFNGNGSTPITGTANSLCLVKSTGNSTELFSRVVFNPIELSSNSTLTINYYIYF